MATLLPMALFALTVPPGGLLVPVAADFPATIRITMAALDPSESPEPDEEGNVPNVPRATLKLVKERVGPVDDDSDEEDDEYLQALLANGADSDDEDSEADSDDEPNGGPSDPAKSKKARQEAAILKLLEATKDADSDDEMEDAKTNGKVSKKGKEPATGEEDSEEDEDDEDDSDDEDLDQPYTICTLDTERHYQQTLDLTVNENETAYFMVSGTHAITVTGNYVLPHDHEDEDSDEDDDDYDLPPDMDELVAGDDGSSDELDELEDARIEELDSEEEEEAPKLVAATKDKKGKKRPAEEEGLDELIAKSSKNQKKLKTNQGEAAEAPKAEAKKESKSDKKVQFAKNLEQGPTGSSAEKAKQGDKAGLGVKVVQGVTIDDRKLGSGRAVKNGDKVSLRYVGKLDGGKVFDSNKKGAPFTFKVGKGEVIKGWDTGLIGLAIGGERRLIIPPSLAYGSKKMDGIPPNSTLTFDVKLLAIN